MAANSNSTHIVREKKTGEQRRFADDVDGPVFPDFVSENAKQDFS